jgi:hypothetical protein
MKIRIEENSVRYRLRKSEVEKLSREGEVACHTQFPDGSLHYILKLHPDARGLSATFTEGTITITLPEAWGLDWPDSSEVGFQAAQILEDGTQLHLLIEKDFVCLDRDPATQQDQYPHPKGEGGEAAC